MTTIPESNRYLRQEDLVPRQRLVSVKATVIGVGAIGRQVSLQLAGIGVPRLQLVDFDQVDLTNITTQGYLADDVGQPKVEATAAAIARLDPTIAVEAAQDRYRARMQIGDAVFCAVDSITARTAIWRSVGPKCQFWADGRMLSEVIRVLAVAGNDGRDYYPTTLFAQSQAQSGSCTAQYDLCGEHRGGPDGPPVRARGCAAAGRPRHFTEPSGRRMVGPLIDLPFGANSCNFGTQAGVA